MKGEKTVDSGTRVFAAGECVPRGTRETPGMGRPAEGGIPDALKAVAGAKVVGVKIVDIRNSEHSIFGNGPFWRVVYDVAYDSGDSIRFTAISRTTEIDLQLR